MIKVLRESHLTNNTVSIEIRREFVLEDSLKEAKKLKFDPSKTIKVKGLLLLIY